MEQVRLILQDATNYGFWNFIAYFLLIHIFSSFALGVVKAVLISFTNNKQP